MPLRPLLLQTIKRTKLITNFTCFLQSIVLLGLLVIFDNKEQIKIFRNLPIKHKIIRVPTREIETSLILNNFTYMEDLRRNQFPRIGIL